MKRKQRRTIRSRLFCTNEMIKYVKKKRYEDDKKPKEHNSHSGTPRPYVSNHFYLWFFLPSSIKS